MHPHGELCSLPETPPTLQGKTMSGRNVSGTAPKSPVAEALRLYDSGHRTMALLALDTALTLIENDDELLACMYAGLAKSCLALYCTERERIRTAAATSPEATPKSTSLPRGEGQQT
jgi:hypothetical protein